MGELRCALARRFNRVKNDGRPHRIEQQRHSQCGAEWLRRWPMGSLRRRLPPGAWRRLAEFVQRQATSKWIIATDFCIRDAARPNNSFAFVLLPAGDRRGQTNALLGELPNKDLKRARTIDPAMKRALRDGRAFTICFVADRERRLYRDAQAARSSLDQMIENAQRWKNAADCAKIIDEAPGHEG